MAEPPSHSDDLSDSMAQLSISGRATPRPSTAAPPTIPVSMVEIQGKEGPGERAPFAAMEEIAAQAPRFGEKPGEAAAAKQLDEQKDKWMQRSTLPPFTARNEKEAEDFMDAAADFIRPNSLSPAMFQSLAAAKMPRQHARVMLAGPADDYEELVDHFMKELYPRSHYVAELEQVLFVARRHSTVLLGRLWLQDHAARYLRLCRRWEWDPAIPATRLLEIAYTTIPTVFEYEVRRVEKPTTVPDLYKAALDLEELYVKKHGGPPPLEESVSFPAASIEEQRSAPSFPGTGAARRIPGPCPRCGETGHWAKDCRFRKSRCRQCDRIGHIASACRNLVVRDESGGVHVRVEPKPGGTEVTHARDRTQEDRAKRSTGFMNALLEAARLRRERAQKKRQEKETPRKRRREGVALHANAEDPSKDVVDALLYMFGDGSSGDSSESLD